MAFNKSGDIKFDMNFCSDTLEVCRFAGNMSGDQISLNQYSHFFDQRINLEKSHYGEQIEAILQFNVDFDDVFFSFYI